MKARRTVEVTKAKCRHEGQTKTYHSGASAWSCKGCPFFWGSVGSGGPSSDSVGCRVVEEAEWDSDHPLYGYTYEVWDKGVRCVKAAKKRKKVKT